MKSSGIAAAFLIPTALSTLWECVIIKNWKIIIRKGKET